LPTTRRAILNLLKRQGPLDASEVATALSLTPAAVRQQLAHLEEDGLLQHEQVAPEGPRRGRRRYLFGLTPAAEALYPKRYGDLTTELLGYLGGPDATQVDELFEQRRRRRVAGALPRTSGLSFDEQVKVLTSILDEDGYLAEAERLPDGSWRITEHNCAILTVAHGFSQACTSELAFIREALPGADVRRVAHIMDGAHVCAYLVSPPSS
jgi:DeoR family suf operon transcriptional repressor